MASVEHRVRPTRCADAIFTVKHHPGLKPGTARGPQMVPDSADPQPRMIDASHEEGPLTWCFVQRQRA